MPLWIQLLSKGIFKNALTMSYLVYISFKKTYDIMSRVILCTFLSRITTLRQFMINYLKHCSIGWQIAPSQTLLFEKLKTHNNTIIKIRNFWITLCTKSLKIISDLQKYIIEMIELDPKFWKSAICNNFAIQKFPIIW